MKKLITVNLEDYHCEYGNKDLETYLSQWNSVKKELYNKGYTNLRWDKYCRLVGDRPPTIEEHQILEKEELVKEKRKKAAKKASETRKAKKRNEELKLLQKLKEKYEHSKNS